VLGHTLEEIGLLLELSVPAVKAALHRGRVRLRQLAEAPPAVAPLRRRMRRYASFAIFGMCPT
jgi:RNA polymerase sigma-70 factor (ECF subfamily)